MPAPPAAEVIVRDVDQLGRVLADCVERRFGELGRLSLALPGGSAAERLCPALVSARIRWRSVDLFWVDERAVPPADLESNYRVVDQRLLSRVHADPARIHRMQGEASDLDAAAREYERRLVRSSGAPPHLDIVLLGVGPDGHVCSLFPDHRALAERHRLVLPIEDAPKPPPRRLTLTLPALAGALVVIAAFDDSKAAVVREALEQPDSRLPVALAARGARRVIYLLSPAVGIHQPPQ